jgi:lysophospholipase L1-like esterase
MLKRAWWSAAIWLVAATAAAAEVVKDDWDWPTAMAAVAKKHTGEPGKVVPIGDSITYANSAGRWARRGDGRTPEELAICTWMRADKNDKTNGWWLAADDQPSGRSWTAASGMTAAQCLAGGHSGLPALDAILKDHDPQIAVILLGTNDAGKKVPVEKYLKAMETIYEKCLANGTIPVVTTVPPRNPDPAGLIGSYNAGLVALAKKHGLPLVDYHGEILARQPGDAWQGTLISKDGVHPTPELAAGPATPENLAKCGYLLRCWLNVHKVMEIKDKVLDNAAGGAKTAPAARPATRTGSR